MTSTQDAALDFRKALAHFPTGVVVISGMSDGVPVGLTVQSFMALSLDPALILVSIDRKSSSWPLIAPTGRFAVNILADDQQDIALSFARSGADKFAGVPWAAGPHTGAPHLQGCQAWIECETWQVYDGGDHEIVTARVLGLGVAADPASHPLVFFRSRFPRLDRAHWDSLHA